MVKQTLVKNKTVKKSQKKLQISNTPPQDVSSPPASPASAPSESIPKKKMKPKKIIEEPSEAIPQQKQKKAKKAKISKRVERKSSTESLAPEMLERLSSVIDLADIEANGFSQDLWRSLSFEEKSNLPIFISLQFRTSSTREEKKKNQKRKQTLNGIMLRYQKLAIRQFYLANKKKIKLLREENSISGNKATEMLWNTLSSEEKNDWYHQSTLEMEEGKQQPGEEKEDESDVDSLVSEEE
jgi:hypothetical protein